MGRSAARQPDRRRASRRSWQPWLARRTATGPGGPVEPGEDTEPGDEPGGDGHHHLRRPGSQRRRCPLATAGPAALDHRGGAGSDGQPRWWLAGRQGRDQPHSSSGADTNTAEATGDQCRPDERDGGEKPGDDADHIADAARKLVAG